MFNFMSFRKFKREKVEDLPLTSTLTPFSQKTLRSSSFTKLFKKTSATLDCDGIKKKSFDRENDEKHSTKEVSSSGTKNNNKENKSSNVQMVKRDETRIKVLSGQDNSCQTENCKIIENRPSKRRPPPVSLNTNQSSLSLNEPFLSRKKIHLQQLTDLVQAQDISEAEKEQLERFLISRSNIGELNNSDLLIEKELGFGNGGVVYKVKHSKSDTTMAKKVLFKKKNFMLYFY